MSEAVLTPDAPETPTEVAVEPSAPTSWRESLPTDLRNHPAIEQTKDVGDLAKQWVNVQSLIGGEKMPAPPAESEKWTDDQWNMHYTRLGRPESKRAFAAAAGGQSDSLRLLRLSDGTELGNHPDFIRMMAGLGEKISEDGLTGEKTSARFTMTPEEATREIASFRYENREAIQSANHPEHQESVARLGQLYAMAYPEE